MTCSICGSEFHTRSHCPLEEAMKRTMIIFAAFILAGCATFDGLTLDNRVACTAARDKAFSVSQWGPVGITAQIADADAKVICK
jgi:hypothetical protein